MMSNQISINVLLLFDISETSDKTFLKDNSTFSQFDFMSHSTVSLDSFSSLCKDPSLKILKTSFPRKTNDPFGK